MMTGFTRLENSTDLAVLLALPAGLVKPYLFLLSRAKLNDPCVSWDEVAEACGLKRRQVFDALASLAARGLAVRKSALWQCGKAHLNSEVDQVSSAENRTVKSRRVRKTALKSAENRTEECGKPHLIVRKTALEHPKNTVQDSENEVSKEVEQKRTEVEQKNYIANDARLLFEESSELQVLELPKPTPRRRDVKPREPNARGDMFVAIASTCFGVTRLSGAPLGQTNRAVESLLKMGFTAADVPGICEWIAQNEGWRILEPSLLEKSAPKWKSGMSTARTKTPVPNASNLNSDAYWAQARAEQDEYLRSIGIDPNGSEEIHV